MKKLRKILGVFLSAAVALTLFTAFPVRPAAASPSFIHMRIEGQRAEIYNGEADFTPGQNFFDIMKNTLDAKNIEFDASTGPYGHEITSIGGESGTYPVWWHLYVNGEASQVGVDGYLPAAGDDVVFYLADDSRALFPTVEITPKKPVAGQKATVHVSATYTDYSDWTNPVTKTLDIPNVAVTFDGKTVETGADGRVELTMPDSAGDYILRAEKENPDSTAGIVRTGDMTLTVGAAANDGQDSGAGQPPVSGGGSGTGSHETAQTDAAIVSGAGAILKDGVNYWSAALAVRAAGQTVPQSYFDSVAGDLDAGGLLPTNLAGLVIGIRAAGGNPESFNGKNLVAQLAKSDIGQTGLNGYTYALLAFDCGAYDTAPLSRNKIVDTILSYQQENGAFSLGKATPSDSDMTAIAVTALAPYLQDGGVKSAVDKAVAYLSAIQKSSGGFQPYYTTTEVCESDAQVVIALSSVGIDAMRDPRFVKDGHSAYAALLSYRLAGGAFAHTARGGADAVATQQAVTALAAYRGFLTGGKRVYDLTAVKTQAATTGSAKVTNPDTGMDGAGGAAAVLVICAAAIAVAAKRRKD